MAYRKPIVLDDGQLEQIQSGDGVDVGAFQLPETVGSPSQQLAVPDSGTVLEWKDQSVDDIPMTNDNAGSIVIGQAVYTKVNGNVDLAQADAGATTEVLGLVKDASIASAASGQILVDGVLTATTGQWDTVTGDSGGLTPGSIYYLDAATAGGLTKTAPTTVGQHVVRVGRAISSMKLALMITAPILL